ncbi:MAG TPA: helix-turn-helix domain-containing protein [Jiangellaceae bacterium]|nr:helix-turn-helix domain-containing protein [Jiangellaceae bacterium]
MTLAVIGIGATQERVYRALLAQPDATTGMLAGKLGLPEETVVSALKAVAERGLAARSAAGCDRYVPAPPAVALGAILTQYRDDLRSVDVALAELNEEYRRASQTRSIKDVIEVVAGADAIRHRFEQLQLGAKDEVLAFITGPAVAVSYAENTARLRAKERGVVYQRVIDRGELDSPELVAEITARVRLGEEIRVVASLPMKLVIADRSTALVGLLTDGVPAALFIHSSGLLDGLVALFDRTWRDAVPLLIGAHGLAEEGAAETGMDPTDIKILGLLLAGLTDQSVASQLDVSVRTVQRRVKHLMEVAGVQTRMQLGWHAARNGWV